MEFTEKETQKYNGVTKQDLKDFKNREIVYNSTLSSCLGSENAVLTLENERVFYEEMKKFFERLKTKDNLKKYPDFMKVQFFYRWLQNFLVKHEKTNKAINYIYSKTLLNELKEAAIILYYQEATEE